MKTASSLSGEEIILSLKSMTAFGSGEIQAANTIYRCEIRTLNSRFCDISIKMPRSLIALEPQLINRAKERLSRGKVDVFLDLLPIDRSSTLPQLNQAAVEHYLALGRQLAERCGESLLPLGTYEFLRLEGVLENQNTLSSSSEEWMRKHEAGLFAAVNQAFTALVKQRESEGQALGKALEKLLEQIGDDRRAIFEKRELIQKNVYDLYKKRLDRILVASDETGQKIRHMLPEERILSELAILTDRTDIDEELTRLEAHEEEFRRLLLGGEEVGRRMDFLCQEMHREINTISNKLTQLEVAQHTLSLKQAVERLRQQVQNIE